MVGGQGAGVIQGSEIQSGISGGPPGNGSVQTDVTYTNNSGDGWRFGVDGSYGGALVMTWEEILAGVIVNGLDQVSLSTSNPDGFIHVLANFGGTFTGTEDKTFTLAELPPQGSYFRRGYDSGNMLPATGPQITWRVRTYIYPGDPAILITQIDGTNNTGSPVTLAGADGMEIALIGGLSTANQGSGAANAWPGTSGKYATAIGGSETAWPGDTTPGPTTANPVYVYISPVFATSGLALTPFCIRKTGLIEASVGTTAKVSFLGPPDAASSRVKVKVQVTDSSLGTGASFSLFYMQGLKRGVAAGDVNSIAADYTQPDASFTSVANGTVTGWVDAEGLYAFASTSGNSLSFQHSISGTVTARWNPRYKVTGWTARNQPVKITLGGTALVNDVDFVAYLDSVNSVLYVILLHPIVASGATGNQVNNGVISITDGPTAARSRVATAGGY